MLRFQFESGEGRDYNDNDVKYNSVNYLWADDNEVRAVAEIEIPEDAEVTEDYGYLTMKQALIQVLEDLGVKKEIEWFYENDDILTADARVDLPVLVDVETEDDYIYKTV